MCRIQNIALLAGYSILDVCSAHDGETGLFLKSNLQQLTDG